LNDKNQVIQAIANQKFRDIAEAYAVLSDKKKRDMVD
jgi:DnaJ-class molecular chaperone